MIIIKFIILILIAISSSYIGILISNKYKNRVVELKEIKKSLNIFKTKIEYTYEPIPDIFFEISQNLKQNISQIFINASNKMLSKTAKEAWIEAITEAKTSMNKEDIEIIKDLREAFRKN